MTYTNPQGVYTDPVKYDNRSSSLLQRYMQSLWRPALHRVIDKYVNVPSGVVCDLGCGTLEYSRHLDKVSRIYAVDKNRAMVESGKSKIKRLKTKFRFLVSDSLHTPIPAGRCDAVICVGLIEFVDLAKLWSEINRISAPASTVLFSFPNRYNSLVLMEHFYQKFIRCKFVKNIYSFSDIRSTADHYGYRIMEINNLGALYWVPKGLEKYFSWSWPLLEKLNSAVQKIIPLGAYTYLVLVRQTI
jgi:ubiquinone/menaquinone biosynthesis C-methylase UbiE